MIVGGGWVGPYEDPDRYELIELRSEGGEGRLWQAALTVDRTVLTVAMKVVHERHLADVGEWRTRWRRQAEVLRSLDHPGLIRVREFFEGPPPHPRGQAVADERALYLAMNWMNGLSLEEWARQHPGRHVDASLAVIRRVAHAVDYLHSGADTGIPVIHRDIKPANVLINANDVKLVDFGFARMMDHSSMTFAGTPEYIAPETVLHGAPFSPATDRYALGVTTFFALTGDSLGGLDDLTRRARVAKALGVPVDRKSVV